MRNMWSGKLFRAYVFFTAFLISGTFPANSRIVLYPKKICNIRRHFWGLSIGGEEVDYFILFHSD